MAYRIYHTEALVLGGLPYGEANRLYQLLTPDLGLVNAIAQGARDLKSKLRPHLHYCGLVRISLVRGREFWRLIAAEEALTWRLAQLGGEKRRVLLQVCQLLRRLIRGEEGNEALFTQLKQDLNDLAAGDYTSEELHNYELVLVARLLQHLGYLELKEVSGYDLDMSQREGLTMMINQALRHSHL